MVEIKSLAAFEQHLASGKSLSNVILQGLDITDALEEVLANQGRPRKVVAIMGGHTMLDGQPELLTDPREHIVQALVEFDRELEARDVR